MVRFNFVLFTSFLIVVTSEPLLDDSNYLFKKESGKDCNWVSQEPEIRCARKDEENDWDLVCDFCPETCSAAGFVSGNCDPIRAVSDIRFNKLPPIDDTWKLESLDYVSGVHKKIYPMLPDDYPFTDTYLSKLIPSETFADSVLLPGDIELEGNTAAKWLADPKNFLDPPIYPGDIDGKFWDELRHVVDAQMKRRSGQPPSSLNTWPKIWEDLTSLTDIASAVAGEYPALHQQTFIGTVFKDGFEMLMNSQPFRSKRDFVGTQVRIADISTWAFHAVSPINFMLKWHVGMPRPEEMAWLISRGELTSDDDGVPKDIVDNINSMNLEKATDFTAYDGVGCPTHPSWPAMHSAGSTVSFWLPAIAKITPEQYCEALRVDYAVSYGRTVAGVHYPQDNIAGMNIGQRIIREQLPDMLANKYGYDSMKIAVMLEGLSFDWSTFDPEACSIDGVSTADFLAAAVDKLTLFEEFWQLMILQQPSSSSVSTVSTGNINVPSDAPSMVPSNVPSNVPLPTVPVIDLGSAGDFTILTQTGITNVPGTVITGDIGVSPIASTAMTGFTLTMASDGQSSTSSQVVDGAAYAASYGGVTASHLGAAVLDMGTAYTDAASRATNDDSDNYLNLGAGLIGGRTLNPGVYTFVSGVSITSDVTLTGTANDVFIIQMTGSLAVTANMKVILAGGVQAKNVFWQVAGLVNVGAGATMEGILLIKTGATFITGSILNGRVLAQTACILQQATITGPSN